MVKRLKHRFYDRQLLFGAVKLTENANPDKYEYKGYCIGQTVARVRT